jgi:hypothetical protein
MGDDGQGLAVERGCRVHGDDGVAPGAKALAINLSIDALPSDTQDRILAGILPVGEQATAVYRPARVYVSEPGRDTAKWGVGDRIRPVIVLTPRRLLVFYVFTDVNESGGGLVVGQAGLTRCRGYDSLPLRGDMEVTTCNSGRFSVEWPGTVAVEVFATQMGLPPVFGHKSLETFNRALQAAIERLR